MGSCFLWSGPFQKQTLRSDLLGRGAYQMDKATWVEIDVLPAFRAIGGGFGRADGFYLAKSKFEFWWSFTK